MAYKQDGFLTGLLSNFRQRKALKEQAVGTQGAVRGNKVAMAMDGKWVGEVPMRKYTKMALGNKVSTSAGFDSDAHRIKTGEPLVPDDKKVHFMDVTSTPTELKDKKSGKKDKSRNVKVKKRRVKTPDAKYGISKGKKGYQQKRNIK